MTKISRITLVLVLPVLVSLSTCKLIDSDVVAACQEYCGVLRDCGMLPSFLGASTEHDTDEDCVARCELSTDVRDQVRACMVHSDALETTDLDTNVANWCSLGACDRLAECLTAEIDPDVIGSGTIETQICRTSDPVARIGLDQTFELEQCSDGCSEDDTLCTCSDDFLDDDAIAAICGLWTVKVSNELTTDESEFEALMAVDVDVSKVSLELHSLSHSITVIEDVCEDVLAKSHEADDVPLGLYRTQLVIQDESDNCYVIPGEQFLVTAGSETTAVWLLPTSFTNVRVVEHEIGTTACSDTIDNDRDGLSDCSDLHCQAYCEICNDSVDNDNDGALDCEDTQCVNDPICVSESEDSTDSTT